MQTSVIVIVALLLIVVVGERVNYVLNRKIAAKVGAPATGILGTLMDGCPMMSSEDTPDQVLVVDQVPLTNASASEAAAAATTSGFSGNDFLAHAREMDARKLRTGSPSSPAKKMENMMASNDQAARRLRSILVKGG